MKKIEFLLRLNLITFYINFKYLKFKDAIKLPILVFGKVSVHKLGGTITIDGALKTGMITLGLIKVGIFPNNIPCVLDIHGNVKFKGRAKFGKGVSISVHKGSVLTFGSNFKLSGNSAIIAADGKNVTFGEDCLLSWDVLILNSDFHNLLDGEEIINHPKDIHFGDKVWIGCGSTILKGVTIPNGCVIAANSTVTKALASENSIYAGNPAKNIKNNVRWVS